MKKFKLFKALMLIVSIMLISPQMWGEDFTAAEIIASGGTTKSNVKVSSSATSTTAKKLCTSQTSVQAVAISSYANGTYSSHYVEVQATSGTLSSLSFKIRGNSDGTGAFVLVFWTGEAAAAYSSYSNSYSYINRAGSDCDGSVAISLPANTKTVRIYRQIYIKSGSISSASGYTTVTSRGALNIFGISATASTPRTFKSGETIYFKDYSSGMSSTLGGAHWKDASGNVYAKFYDASAKTWTYCASYADLVSGSWNGDNAIYKIIVPGSSKTYTKVIFTRGTSNSDGSTWNKTVEQTPEIGKNMFIIADSKSGDDWTGSWSKYAKDPALIGDFNDWDPDKGTFVDGKVVLELEASTDYEFKVLVGDGTVNTNYWSCSLCSKATNTVDPWQQLYSNQDNWSMTSGEAGEYCFHWNNSTHYLGIYYPQARLKKNTYIYFDVTSETYWNSAAFDAKFYMKYYDSGDNLTGMPLSCTTPLESYVYYAVVPNNDYVGRIQMNRYVNSSEDGVADVCYAYSRSSSLQNCMKEETGKETYKNSWTPQWTTYCPPMSSATLSDNSTAMVSWQTGDGTSANPYLVAASGTIKVIASATKAVNDANMTPMYDFKVSDNGGGASSAQSGTGTTYDKGSLSAGHTYEISLDAWNSYNETNGTKNTSATHKWYKAVTLRNVVHTLSKVTKSSGRVGDNQAADNEPYTATFAAETGYNLPATITVKFGSTTKTSGTDYTWNSSTGVVSIPADKINGNVTITVTGVAKTTSIKLDDNDENNGASGDGSASVNYDATAVTSITHTNPASGYQRTGYWTAKTGGYKVLNADGTFATYSSNISSYISSSNKWCNESENITLYAQYEVLNYTVTFVSNDDAYGTVDVSEITGVTHGSEVSIDDNVLTLKGTDVTATKETDGDCYTYAFSSWSVSDGASITGNTTITATFTATGITYNITYNLNSGNWVSSAKEEAAPAEYTCGVGATLPDDTYVVRDGYTFLGWVSQWDLANTEPPHTPISVVDDEAYGDVEYVAQWESSTYSVTYDGDSPTSGSAPSGASGYAGDGTETVTVAGDNGMSKTGYDFRGWSDGTTFFLAGQTFTMPNHNVTLTAVWDADAASESCTTFTGSSAAASYVTTHWTMYFVDSNGRYNNTNKWYADQTGCNGSAYSFQGAQRFVLVFDEDVASIHFYAYNASARAVNAIKTTTTEPVSGKAASYTELSSSTDYSCTKTGTNGCQEFNIEFDEAIASGTWIWVELSNGVVIQEMCYTPASGGSSNFYVAFDNKTGFEGTTTLPDTIKGVPTGKKILQPTAPTASGYIFGGWYTDAACTSMFSFSGTITQDTTLYAKWTAKTQPDEKNVTGSEYDCGSKLAMVTVQSSQDGVTYDLYVYDEGEDDYIKSDDEKTGDGNDLSWTGLGAGKYRVYAIEDETYASRQMNGTVTVTEYDETDITAQPDGTDEAIIVAINEEFTLGNNMTTQGNITGYQWYEYENAADADDDDDRTEIDGADEETYTTSHTSAGTHYYKVKVTGSCGDPVYSDMITVTVTATHSVTVSYNGSGSYGTASAASSTVAEGGTTTITASPATGYQVTAWAASGTGASVSDNGSTHSTTTTLTMGTADATVTCTFGAISYTVTLDNQGADSGKEGTTSVTATYNATTNLTSAITKPTKTGYVFGGYYTEEYGRGEQLINASGNWIAEVDGYTGISSTNPTWIYDDDVDLYAYWTVDPTGYLYITDVLEYPQLLAGNTVTSAATDASYDAELDGGFTHTNLAHWAKASAKNTGVYTLTFSSALNASATAAGVAVDVWWGVDNTSNASTYIYLNGTSDSDEIGHYKSSGESQRKTLLEQLKNVQKVGTTSVSSLQLKCNDNPGSTWFRVGIKEIPGYLLTYDDGDGSGAPSASYQPNATIVLSETVPTQSGYIFRGWQVGGSGTVYQPGNEFSMPAEAVTLVAKWDAICMNFAAATSGSSDVSAGTTKEISTASGGYASTLSGGSMSFYGRVGKIGNNDTYGLVFDSKDDELLTVTLTDAMLEAGAIIILDCYSVNSDSKEVGFTLSGNTCAEGNYTTTAAAYQRFTRTYVVTDDDGIDGTSSFTIEGATTNKVYLKGLQIAGCTSCTGINPTLTYSATTLYAFGGKPNTATPTLTGNTGSGTVTYSSSNTDVVTVNASSGLVTAVGTGTATVTAVIDANGGYCGAIKTVTFTVPALVQQTVRTGNSTSWNGDGSAAPNMTFPGDPTGTLTQSAVISWTGYTFDATVSGSDDRGGMTAKFTGVPSSTSKNDSYYLSLSFNTPTHAIKLTDVIVPIQPVSQSVSAIATLSDGTTTITSSEVTDMSAGTVHQAKFTFTPTVFAKDKTITLKVFVYDQETGTNGFRLASPILINGGVQRYSVTYDGNGATGGSVTDASFYAYDGFVIVSYNYNGFTRTGNYEFNGWNTKADGSGTDFDYYSYPNDHFRITQDTTLYAQWRMVVSTNTTNLDAFDEPEHKDVRITNGATLTVSKNVTVRNTLVETGSTLNISTNSGSAITFTTDSLSLKGGWGTVGGDTKYDMPRVYIDPKSKLTRNNSTHIVNFDIAVDNRSYYPFALPFDVPLKISDGAAHYEDPYIVDYPNNTLAYYSNYGANGQYAIKYYDGQSRANNGASSTNWKHMSSGTTLKAGRGYALTALPAPGYGDYAVIRFPMVVDGAWTATGELGRYTDDKSVDHIKDTVRVIAYKKAGTGEGTGDGTPKANVGWNLLGVPYMSCYTTGSNMYNESNVADPATLIQGRFNYSTNKWEDGEIMYVTVPTHDFSEYIQADITDAGTVLLPGWCFFVQVAETGNLRFLSASEAASSSLPIYAPKREQEHMPTVRTGIILSGANASDKTTILVSDKYSAAEYEINADLEKMFGENGYTLATYSLSGATRLAYNALSNADAMNIIPIGYRAAEDGEYTFSINPRYAENFEQVNLIDYETGIMTDLMTTSYIFSTERTQNDARFALNVVPKAETPTDLNGGEANGERTKVRKVLIDDKLYIILDGKMYDATGRMVK